MSAPIKRHSAAGCIAWFYCSDIKDISDCRYQSTRYPIPVYTLGDDYVCCPRAGGKPPEGFNWEPQGKTYNDRTVYRAALNNKGATGKQP